MTRANAFALADAMNLHRQEGLGHTWVNTGVTEADYTVSVRNIRGVETEVNVFPDSWYKAKAIMRLAARATEPDVIGEGGIPL